MKRNQSRVPRVFLGADLSDSSVELEDHHAHYLRHVLRLRSGDSLVLFNGLGDERHGIIDTLARNRSRVRMTEVTEPLPESPLELSLMPAVAKSEAMDLIIQKSAELGVRSISPVLTDFSVVKLDGPRAVKRAEHWRKIARGACEQSGRHYPPTVHEPQKLHDALSRIPEETTRVALQPASAETLHDVDLGEGRRVLILIGPEGGLSDADLERAESAGFRQVSLGPRILRTETAALAACTLAQSLWGDLSP